MCGIAGEVRFDGNDSNLAVIKSMCDTQMHRGPDDEGYYKRGHVALGIRRLSIIDLRKGLYPIKNEEGTIHLIFNGEVYGFHELRAELEASGHMFRSNTDGETIVHAYEQWDTECLHRFDGMYAFALFDENKQALWVVRDPFGIKPLYYVRNKKFFAFASEIKPLLSHPEVSRRPNESAIEQYLLSGLVETGDETFFAGIWRLRPSHHMLVHPNGSVNVSRYWSPSVSKRIDGEVSAEEVERTRSGFLDAVRLQLISDVPVGTCLSGGLDSSSIVCAIKKVHPDGAASIGEKLKTFSATFTGESFDEAKHAQRICTLTGAEHNAVSPTAEEFWADLPALVNCQEEPFFSTSIYAQWRVMKQAKERGITVILDGQGGDELLAGYHPYFQYYLLNLLRMGSYMRLVREGIRSSSIVVPLLGSYLRLMLKRVGRFGHATPAGLLRELLEKNVSTNGTRFSDAPHSDLARKLEVDVAAAKLPALLRYEDKNSMWHSIEARVPFLHRRFFEYVAALPLDRKIRNGFTKYVFRLAMAGILPDEIRLRRDKIGFETPERKWIDALRLRLVEFFSVSKIAGGRYYDAEKVVQLLQRGNFSDDEAHVIWRILNLEMWYRQFLIKSASGEVAVAQERTR